MKTSHKFLRFFFLFTFSFIIIGYSPLSLGTSIKKFMTEGFELDTPQQSGSAGNFLLKNSRNGQPLDNYQMYIVDAGTGTLVDSVKSDETGEMKADELVDGKVYRLRFVPVDEDSAAFKAAEEVYVHEPTSSPVVIKTYVEREANRIGIPTVRQNPELPNGCEITTLTAVLTYHGIKTTKTKMADDYLPKEPFEFREGKRLGPDPHQAYAGDPRSADVGWYSFAGPIVEASQKIIEDKGSRLITENVSGSSREEILSFMDQNIPVIVWVTLDLSPPVISGGWKDGEVIVMDPLKGLVTHPEDTFFESYEALGSQAITVKR